MRDLLVRYLLGELDDDQRQWLEDELRRSADLRRELAYLRSCMPESEWDSSDEPPSDLASRTVGRIADPEFGDDSCPEEDRARAIAAAQDPPVGVASWSLADLTVAGGIFLAVSMLFLPALRQSRDASRRIECANHLRQLGTLLISYSEDHGGFFPVVSRGQNAGIFAVQLVHEGYVTPEELARLLLCRSSALGEEVAAGRATVRIPCRKELRCASPDELARLRQSMGGSYAYRIGYVDANRYCGIRNDRSCRSPLLADSPNYAANFQSDNHGGGGQNVLHQDGSVRYQITCTLPDHDDHLFLNVEGVPEAGRGRFDAVLVRSEVTPGTVPRECIP